MTINEQFTAYIAAFPQKIPDPVRAHWQRIFYSGYGACFAKLMLDLKDKSPAEQANVIEAVRAELLVYFESAEGGDAVDKAINGAKAAVAKKP